MEAATWLADRDFGKPAADRDHDALGIGDHDAMGNPLIEA